MLLLLSDASCLSLAGLAVEHARNVLSLEMSGCLEGADARSWDVSGLRTQPEIPMFFF